MYFDLKPKNNSKDLYDFEQPFGRLLKLLNDRGARAPLITVTGLRRTGKTSLIKTGLAESSFPYVALNGYAFADEPTIKKSSLMAHLERELNDAIQEQKKWKDKILEGLRGIRWLRVSPEFPWIHFEWGRSTSDFDILDVLYSFNQLARKHETKSLFIVDEAQEFRKLKGYSLQKLMTFAYDNLDNVQIIVSGSQFGLLQDFLGIDNPSASLYGRGAIDIHVPRLSEEQATDFLQKGFEQVGIKPTSMIIESAVKKLDGIIGWLTFFGAVSVELGACTEKVLDSAMERGSKLSLKEFQNFLKLRPGAEERYMHVMTAAARIERASWTNLKQNLEIRGHKAIADKIFDNLIGNLVNGEYLRKNEDGTYSVPDPMLAYGLTH